MEDSLVTAREEMRFRATHDGLTQLLNRTSIIKTLRNELEGTLVEREFAVVICDVDHFKRINDTYGHPVGDEVLREVAHRLKHCVRVTDVVGRFGGEEFLFVLKDCTADGLPQLTEQICQSVRSSAILTTAGMLHVSISAGALHVGRVKGFESEDHVLQTVDAALYKAKSSGRDGFIVAPYDRALLAVA